MLALEMENIDGESDVEEEWVILNMSLQTAVIVKEYMVRTEGGCIIGALYKLLVTSECDGLMIIEMY